MAKVTIRAEIPCPVERVWAVVTDLRHWHWRSNVTDLRATRDGRTFVEYDRRGVATYYRVTAFAPRRWYALDIINERLSGSWEGFFVSSEGGTRVEFTETIQTGNPVSEFLAGTYLRRKQRQYMTDLFRALGVD